MQPWGQVALLLAGGKSRRLGRDKRLLDVGGKPFLRTLSDQLQRRGVNCFLAVDAESDALGDLSGVVRWWDRSPGTGPFLAVLHALERCEESLLVLAADRWVEPWDSIRRIVDFTAGADTLVVAAELDGTLDPLCALYDPRAAAPLSSAAEAGESSLRRFLETQPEGFVERVRLEHDALAPDLDRAEQLARCRSLVEENS